jgi:DNA-binding XRE family transcriptional regulator
VFTGEHPDQRIDEAAGLSQLLTRVLEFLGLSQHSIYDRSLPICDLHLKAVIRPYPYRWKCTQVVPTEPRTVGEHLKRRRLELHLFQSDLAKVLGVDVESIRKWEKDTYQPIKRLMLGIVKWLGYDPRKAVEGTRPRATRN